VTHPPDDNASHILIIDDDRRIRQLLTKYLTEHNYRVTAAENAGQARARMKGMDFDLLVLDVMMPGESGLDFARDLRIGNEVPILMLSALSEKEQRIVGLEAGVDDYLSKPFEPRELLLRIASILRRSRTQIPVPNEIRMGDIAFLSAHGELNRAGISINLTSRECDLLRILSSESGKTFSRTELSEQDGMGRERSVDVLVNRLRQKIEPDPANPVYLRTIRGAGYALFCE